MSWWKHIGAVANQKVEAEGNQKMPDAKTVADHNRRVEDKYAHIEKLALDEQTKLLANKDEKWAQMLAEFEKDKKGYKFQCARWGNFLNLSIARLGNAEPSSENTWWQPHPRYYSGSLNLDLIKEISFTEGSEPALDFTVTYRHSVNHTTDGDKDNIYSNAQAVKTSSPMINFEPEPSKNGSGMGNSLYYGQNEPYKTKLTTPDYPRQAEDDKIIFRGVGATLYAPAGMGSDLYKRILKCTTLKK